MSLRRLLPKRFRRQHKVHKDTSKFPGVSLVSSGEELLRLKGGDGTQDLVALVIAFATATRRDPDSPNDQNDQMAWASFQAICLRMGFKIPDTARNDFYWVRVAAFQLLNGQDTLLFASQMREIASEFVKTYFKSKTYKGPSSF